MMPDFMEGVCTANRGHLLHYLEKSGVSLMNCARVVSFSKNRVHVQKNNSKNVPNPYTTWRPLLPENIPNPLSKKPGNSREDIAIDADLVVLALGGRPDQTLYYDVIKAKIAPEVLNIGDSERAGRVLEAARAAYRMAVRI